MEALAVIVAEDEGTLQALLQAALEEAGFSVAISASASEALQMLERPDANHVALVTDIHLGDAGVTGWDVARRARELNPSLPVVYMTGAAASDWPANGVPNSILITKPFAPAQVVTAISQLLNLGASPAP
jgi:CheY-like chemotaxis protein